MHFPLQKHYTSQATLFSFKMCYFEIINRTWKVQMTDFRSFTGLQKYLLSYQILSKSSKKLHVPKLNSSGIPQLTIFSSTVRMWSSLPRLQDNETRTVSAQSTPKKQPDFISLNFLCEEPIATFPWKKINIEKIS